MAQYLPVLVVSPQWQYRLYRQNEELVCFDESLRRVTQSLSQRLSLEDSLCVELYLHIFRKCVREISPSVREQKQGLSGVSLCWQEEGRYVSWHHEENAQSHSVCTDDGDAAYTPRHQTHPETSPIHTHRGQQRHRQHMSPASVCLDCCSLGYCKHAQCFFFSMTMTLSSPPQSHLEMVNVLLCIQVYASGSLLYGHDRQADIYTAMQLSFLNLTQTWRIRLIL